MNDVYETNTATQNTTQEQNWLQRNADWLTPIATSAAQIGYNVWANDRNNQFNAEQAQLNRDWQAQQANTAYQRGYADMKAAGLNPHLAGGNGGAATGSGGQAATTGMMPADFNSLNGYALQTAMTQAQVNNLEADTELKGQQAGKTEQEMEGIKIENQYKDELKKLEILSQQITNEKTKAEVQKTFAEVHNLEKELRKMDEEIGILKSEGKIKEAEAKTRTRNRRAYAILEMTESATRSVGNLVGAGAKAAAVGQGAVHNFEM